MWLDALCRPESARAAGTHAGARAIRFREWESRGRAGVRPNGKPGVKVGQSRNVNCQMGCCAMSNVLVSIIRLPNDPLTRWSFGGLVIALSTFHIAQQPFDS